MNDTPHVDPPWRAGRDLVALARILGDTGRGLRKRRLRLRDGQRLHVVEGGRPGARPVLLLHGFCGQHRQMLGVARALAEDHRIVLFDARGHGASDGFTARPTMAQLAADLAELLDDLQAPEVDAVGLSMGAQTLFELARTQGCDRLRRLVFIDQGPRLLPEAGYAHALFGGMQPDEVTAFLHALAVRPRSLGQAWLRGIWRSREPLPVKLVLTPTLLAGLPGVPGPTLQLAADMLHQDWRQAVRAISRPTLLCYGGRSMYPDAGRWMAANMADARLEWFGSSGHGLQFQEPVRLHRVVAGFLGEP